MKCSSLLALLAAVPLSGAGLNTAAAAPWTLERALLCTSTNNPDARIAQQRIAAAQAGIAQADAAIWPRAQLVSSYIRTDSPMLVFGGILNQRAFGPGLNFNDVPDVDNANVRGLVSVPLYEGGRIRAGRDAARAREAGAQAEAEAVNDTLAFETTRAFHTVLKTREFIRAAEAGVKSFESNLVIAQNRVAAGAALKTDALDMEVRLAGAREDLVRARNAEALSTRALRMLLGLEEVEIQVASDAPQVGAPEGTDFSARPELRAIEAAQRAAEAQVRQARAGQRPRIFAFGSLDYDRGWVMNGDGASYSAGLGLQWDVWDGQLARNRVREAEANYAAALEAERKLRLNLGFEVEQARLQLAEAAERLTVTEASVARARESAELNRVRFEQGLVISTQLIDAETALTAARVRRAEAEADRRIAIAALRKALALPQLDPSP